MLLTLQRVVIADNKRFDVRARDHGGGPINSVNPGVDRVVEEFTD